MIRFIDDAGAILHGQDRGDGTATLLYGSIETGFTRQQKIAKIIKLLAPLVPTDIICIGRNYPPHQEIENGKDATLEVFLKPSTALQNPFDPILIPSFDDGVDAQLDCEGELAVVIGKQARNIVEDQALDHIFGYTLANDVTAKRFQTSAGPPLWMRGKGFDTFCPLGPAIVTKDEVPEPHNLVLRTLINEQVVREGNTSQMIRSVPQMIAALSRHMTLRAGTMILTGAPPPVAPLPRLVKGDSVVIQSPLGRLSNTVTSG